MKYTFTPTADGTGVEVSVEGKLTLAKIQQLAQILFPSAGKIKVKEDGDNKFHYEVSSGETWVKPEE